MRRISSGEAFPPWLKGGVVVLGSFDGVHRGHVALIERARAVAGREERPLIIITFDPVPAHLFHPESAPLGLTIAAQCDRLFGRHGADAVVVIDSVELSARFTAKEMIFEWLHGDICPAFVVIGEHFEFGSDRQGNVDRLVGWAEETGISVQVSPAEQDRNGELISSQRIREALRAGDCSVATNLLSRPFAIEDVVRHGHKLGRTIGFPTANMLLNTYVRPRYGVYAVRGRLPHGRVLDGVANLGIRPMMEVEEELLETHFFDYTGDLYGQTLEVELLSHIRDEQKLDGFDELKSWIEKDCFAARSILREMPHFG